MLDSPNTLHSAPGATREPRLDEGILTVSPNEISEWFFLLLKSKDLQLFNSLFTGATKLTVRENEKQVTYTIKFKTFIYTTVQHRKRIVDCQYSEKEYQHRMDRAANIIEEMERDDRDANANQADHVDHADHAESSSAVADEIDTLGMGGGYLFVYAPLHTLKKALNLIVPHRYLVMDLATRKAARIPDEQMKKFVFLYESVPWNLQFMKRPIADYAKNHDKVRITGGKLQGAEGYIVRVKRDRKLVFSFGNMTLSVNGIHAYPFELVDKRPRTATP